MDTYPEDLSLALAERGYCGERRQNAIVTFYKVCAGVGLCVPPDGIILDISISEKESFMHSFAKAMQSEDSDDADDEDSEDEGAIVPPPPSLIEQVTESAPSSMEGATRAKRLRVN